MLEAITNFDRGILDFIAEHIHNPVLDELFKFITFTGEYGAIWIIAAVLCLCFKKTRRAGVAMLIAMVMGVLIGNLLIKNIVDRPRPFITFPEISLIIPPPTEFSFPSGHTLCSFGAATALFIRHKRLGIPALTYAALMGMSRMYLCVHYPTDVMAGCLLGIALAVISHKIISTVIKKQRKGIQNMETYAILGYPLGHSLSPQIHDRLFKLAGKAAEYKILEIPAEQLKDRYSELAALSGFNITIPHKISIIDFCDELDDTAKRYNSVNCISCGEKKIGYNTDCVGFTGSIRAMGASLSGSVLLLGCGGVGRMMAIETARENGRLTIAARSEDIPVAKALCEEINAQYNANADYVLLTEVSGQYDLCVNSTPVGMYPNTEYSPLTDEALSRLEIKYFFDAIYNPRETLLMKQLAAKGVITAGGMDMLVWQAVAAHEIWDGSSYNDADIKQLIEDMKELV